MTSAEAPLHEARRVDLAEVLLVVGCGVAGLALWSGFVVGRIGQESWAAFWILSFVTVAVVGLLSDLGPFTVSAATFAGPLVASLWTAPHGDNDGLWLLVVPTIAAAAGIGCLLVMAIRHFVPRSAKGCSPIGRMIGSHLLVTSIAVTVGAAATLLLLMERRANPYPELERIAATFPAPDSLEERGVRHEGDPLCSGTCRAAVEVTFSTSEGPQDACGSVEDALPTWQGADTRPTESIYNPTAGYFEVCSWRVDVGDTDGYVAVSDEPSGTAVRVLMLDPGGVPR